LVEELIITKIRAREVLDSRGIPTVEAEVFLAGGAKGRAIVPSGASTGSHEALELRDGDPTRYDGRGVRQAVANVNQIIGPEICRRNMPATDQEGLDGLLIELDGTDDKSNLGANAILGVSLAGAHAAAAGMGLPLFRYLAGDATPELPVPMVNIISGGRHAEGGLDFQDFLVIPVGATSYAEGLENCGAVYRVMGRLLQKKGLAGIGVADEGGYGPRLPSNESAVALVTEAIELAGFASGPNGDMAIGLDVAASEFYADGQYYLKVEDRRLSSEDLVGLLHDWVQRYPILSIEDGAAEDDWEGWKLLTQEIGSDVLLIGDDLFTTNPQRLRRGIERGTANAVLVKLNQIGTLTETLAVVRQAQAAGYLPVISARSGETEDTTIADLAVATGAGQIKIGSLTRSERLAKYNQLLRIEEELGGQTRYRGRSVFSRFIQQ
jgi:enolase